MLFIVRRGVSPSPLLEKLRGSSASYRVLNIYGRVIIVAWPDHLVEHISDDVVELKVKPRRPFQLASNEWKLERTIVTVEGVEIGGKRVVVGAGPCAVESEEELVALARALKRAGASLLRGGAFKPRTSPYSFQGLGLMGLKALRRASEESGLPVITEAVDEESLSYVSQYADMVQIGARSMQCFSLLRKAARCGKPVLLKRGFGCTVEEWLLAAEYILLEGNGNVVLCERGIRTFERVTRFTLDVCGLVAAKHMTHLPVGADPSHPSGRREFVEALAMASLAAGADMLLIEVHNDPQRALSDSEQQLAVEEFENMMVRLKALAEAIGRHI